jgi:hypothetical protein
VVSLALPLPNLHPLKHRHRAELSYRVLVVPDQMPMKRKRHLSRSFLIAKTKKKKSGISPT